LQAAGRTSIQNVAGVGGQAGRRRRCGGGSRQCRYAAGKVVEVSRCVAGGAQVATETQQVGRQAEEKWQKRRWRQQGHNRQGVAGSRQAGR